MNHILVVVNELPFPPRNGCTIPAAGFLRGLKEAANWRIDLLFLRRPCELGSIRDIAANLASVDRVFVVSLRNSSSLRAAWNEFTLRQPGFHAYEWDSAELEALGRINYDLIVYTPISAMMVAAAIRGRCNRRIPELLLANDCHTAVLRRLTKMAFLTGVPLRRRAGYLLRGIESLWIARLEAEQVCSVDATVCQTEIDKKEFRAICRNKFGCRIDVISNGVADELFDLPIENRDDAVLFVSMLVGQYRDAFYWLHREVWARLALASGRPVTFEVVGRGLRPEDKQELANTRFLRHREFVPELAEVYRRPAILLAPIFKGYGLINKVVEAMAAGLVVVGDQTAYNGIPGFVAGEHGVVANDAAQMRVAVTRLLEKPTERDAIARAARALVRKEFSWSSRWGLFERLIERLRRDQE
jgi:glycosyltransferase involved in cell wall biosynthesis